MNCPVCGAPLGNGQTRCSGCGYSFSEPLDPGTDVAPPGDHPRELVLAVKLLALGFGVDLVVVFLAYWRVDIFWTMPVWVIWWTFGVFALDALFIALIWRGVRWARMLFLILVGCRLAGVLGGMSLSLSLDMAIDLYVAYLLLQPECRDWFYGYDVTARY